MKSLIHKILKEQTESNEHNLLISGLEKFVSKFSYPELCSIQVDPEPDENDDIWVYVVVSNEWYLREPIHENKVIRVNQIRADLRNKIELRYGLKVRVGSYVKECN